MKNLFFLFLAFGLLTFAACKDDDGDGHTEFDYHAHIMEPADMSTIKMGETLHVHIEFEDHNGETVHNIEVKIYEKDDTSVVTYTESEHVHATSGSHTYEKEITIDGADGFTEHTDYILEASVFGHDDMEGLTTETVQFHVHPM